MGSAPLGSIFGDAGRVGSGEGARGGVEAATDCLNCSCRCCRASSCLCLLEGRARRERERSARERPHSEHVQLFDRLAKLLIGGFFRDQLVLQGALLVTEDKARRLRV